MAKLPITATELCGENPPTEAFQLGRRLKLRFINKDKPELDRIEFQASAAHAPEFWQRGDSAHNFGWTEVPQALALLFLDYVCADRETLALHFSLRGSQKSSLAASLGDAIYQPKHSIHNLLVEAFERGGRTSRVQQILGGDNIHGKRNRERRIQVKPDYLPQDCVEVFWDSRGALPLSRPIEFQTLLQRIQKSLGLEFKEPEIEILEEKPEPITRPPASAKIPVSVPLRPPPIPPKVSMSDAFLESMQGIAQGVKDLAAREPIPPPLPPTLTLAMPDSFLKSVETIAGAVSRAIPPASPPTQKAAPALPAPKQRGDDYSESDERSDTPDSDNETPPEQELFSEDDIAEEVPPARINPLLLQIQNPDALEWSDDDGLIDFGNQETDADVWRIRDACEGLLIFGAVGSGKTSGSGSAIARAYLTAGFGGLVLTAKPDEARRWLRMCEETGRANDYVHITPNSGHKLNFLQYETQRPGERIAVTDDLIALFRCLINVANHTKGNARNEDFWTNTTNQLMRKLTDTLLLAGEPLTLNRMTRFVNNAPQNAKTDWRSLKPFCAILACAKENASQGTDEDKRIFRECFQYWTQTYPAIPAVTRGGFITAFSAMADTLSGRGIYEMVGTETNLTPEMILSGKVVILDIPLKGNIQGGLMVQAIWKLLFQQAVERRADKGLSTARPAFLWEDEGHEFFSEHDVRFQPTARDIRAPHVIISQNIHNFLHLGHDSHAIMAVFAAMNTYIFHTNGDLDTNRWASERIGQIKKLKLTTDGLLKPTRAKDITWFEREPHEVENVGKLSLREEKKSALEPEDFMKLKRGGDGTCEAVVLWLSHRFAVNQNRNFCVLTFEQEQRPN